MNKNKKPTRKDKESSKPSIEFKERVIAVKKRLPASGVTSFFIQMFPEYDSVKGRSSLNNVLQLRTTKSGEDILEKLEILADKTRPENEVQS